ncbi:hypothetical protein [Burkholderia phage vB_BglM_WTB]
MKVSQTHTTVERIETPSQSYTFADIAIGDCFEHVGVLFLKHSYACGSMIGRGANRFDSAQGRTFSMDDEVLPVELLRYKTK